MDTDRQLITEQQREMNLGSLHEYAKLPHMQVKTHINWNTVIQPLPNHCLSLDINVVPVFDGQSLDVLAVQVQRHRLGFHAEGNLVPVAIKQVVNLRVLEHSSDSIFCQADSIVLHRLVLAIQADGHLTSQRQDNVNDQSVNFKPTGREIQRV